MRRRRFCLAHVLGSSGQEIKKLKGGAIEFRTRVDNLDHITDWILSFGDQVEVLSPHSFRNQVKDRISNMCQIYVS
jgi:predicted DNA-binding transcriptional regulator YafY